MQQRRFSHFESIARAMARNYQISVVPSGYDCATDGERIVIPFASDDFKDADIQILNGLLDHEVGHIIEERRHREAEKKTPLEILRTVVDQNERYFFNVLEDIRMERVFGADHVGVGENIARLNLHGAKLWRQRQTRGELNFWVALGAGITERCLGADTSWLPTKIQECLDALQPEIEKAHALKWGSDSYALARAIITKIKEKAEEEKREEKESIEDGIGDEHEHGDDDDKEESDSGSGSEEAEGKEGAVDDVESDESEDAEGEDLDDEGEDEGESASDAYELESDVDENDAESEDLGGEGEGEPSLAEQVACDADITDLVDEARHEVSTVARRDAEENDRYIPDPRAVALDHLDKVETGSATVYRECKERVQDQIAGMKGRLLAILRARMPEHEIGGLRHGRLDTRRLGMLVAGSINVFKKEVAGEKIDTAVEFLVDMSGSMGPGENPVCCAYYARHMALALAETFDALQIPFELIGFDTESCHRSVSKPSDYYTRNAPMRYFGFKLFDQPYRSVKNSLMSITGHEDNDDGEAVLFVAKRLSTRTESRKLLFVLSDGRPSTIGGRGESGTLGDHLRDAIKKATSQGIEVFGIGANSKYVSEYYNESTGAKNVVINDLQKLDKETYKLVSESLTKRCVA
jgi:cobalamin biosynthesis protein CobT